VWACALWLLPLAAGVPALAGEAAAEARSVMRTLGDDTFAAGQRVRITQGSAGDAIVAGADLNLSGGIGGDAVAAGRRLTLRDTVGGDLYAAGGELRIEGSVNGNARVAGSRIELDPAAAIGGGMSVAGGEIEIDGRVGRYLQVAGGDTHINGSIGGDVEVRGGKLEIGPQAVIEGAVIFRGPAPPQVAAGAQVRGGVQHVQADGDGGDELRRGLRTAFGVGALFWLVGWLVVGCLLIAVWPRGTLAVTQAARTRPGRSLLAGLLVLVGAPVLVLILIVTLIGIPLGLLLLAAYLVWLPLGYLAAAATVGEWLLLRLRRGREPVVRERILAFCGVLVALFLMVRIPVAGGLLALLLLLAGMGSLVIALMVRRGRRTVTA
jgi:cytoskeletal protein CcmA (bactofilin family)